MRPYTIVILNHFPDLAKNLATSISRLHAKPQQILVVCDRHQEPIDGARQIYAPGPFVFAANVNKAIEYCTGEDIILVNDDCECVENEFFPNLASIADKYEKCGIMSPLIDGGVGNELQQYPKVKIWERVETPEIITDRTVCFPCVFINRELIDAIGGLDESFTGYGFDDDDYCIRARNAGFKTMITSSIRIKHGDGGTQLMRGFNWSVSFARVPDPKSNLEIFLKKYPHFRVR